MHSNHYQRVPDTGIFAVYSGLDDAGRYSFMVRLTNDPRVDLSSRFLKSVVAKRSIDSLWALTVSIEDERYRGVFGTMVSDLVATIAPIKDSREAEHEFLKRFDEWRTLFTKRIEAKMNRAKIVGLAGELLFLKRILIPQFGATEGIASWGGPESMNQDFTVADGWYEVKTKGENKPTVHISNANQLNCDTTGDLVVIPFAKTTSTDAHGISLMTLYRDIVTLIDDSVVQVEFERKLALVGFYPDEKYSEPAFRFGKFEFYQVRADFPQIKVLQASEAISRIEYDLYIPALKPFLLEEKR